MGKLIANIIGRNEEPHYLRPVIERICEIVDEVVFTDDASTDATAEIAESYGAYVQKLPEPVFSVNEGKLRQSSWDFLESVTSPTEDDWVLAIDCDEMLYYETHPKDMIQTKDFDVINVNFYHMWTETHYRTDGGWRPHGSTRLFRYKPGGEFKQSKIASGSEPTYVAWTAAYFKNRFLIQSGLNMKHLSYIKDIDKIKKYERYMDLDGGNYHAGSHIQSIADPIEKVSLALWEE